MGKEAKISAKSTTKRTMKRKDRFEFKIIHDIVLLRSCLQHNPWQLGQCQWKLVQEELKLNGWELTERTIKLHVQLLLDKLRKETLTVKSGTEEEGSERETLLKDIESVIQQSELPIGSPIVDSDENNLLDIDGMLFDPLDVTAAAVAVELDKGKSSIAEKAKADMDRDLAIKRRANEDETPSPNRVRPKRSKPTFDEEIIQQKQEHDMSTETKRLDQESTKAERDYRLEDKRLELEKAKLDLEVKKEDRLNDEGKRKDELLTLMQTQMQSQLQMQNNMYQLLVKMSEK